MGSKQQASEQLKLPLTWADRGEASKTCGTGAEGPVSGYTEESLVMEISEMEEVVKVYLN